MDYIDPGRIEHGGAVGQGAFGSVFTGMLRVPYAALITRCNKTRLVIKGEHSALPAILDDRSRYLGMYERNISLHYIPPCRVVDVPARFWSYGVLHPCPRDPPSLPLSSASARTLTPDLGGTH
eukprot:scaffold130843_cov15-Tisochrysis_lutea.AAC.1